MQVDLDSQLIAVSHGSSIYLYRDVLTTNGDSCSIAWLVQSVLASLSNPLCLSLTSFSYSSLKASITGSKRWRVWLGSLLRDRLKDLQAEGYDGGVPMSSAAVPFEGVVRHEEERRDTEIQRHRKIETYLLSK